MLSDMQVDIGEAQATLFDLIERALKGETIIISVDSKPAVHLMPIQNQALRSIGLRQHLGFEATSIEASLAPLDEDELEHWTNPQ
jgi:prevent-host-death family protein